MSIYGHNFLLITHQLLVHFELDIIKNEEEHLKTLFWLYLDNVAFWAHKWVRPIHVYQDLGVVHILRNQQRGGGGGGFQMLTVDYGGGGGGLAVDYVIKILIFTLIPI